MKENAAASNTARDTDARNVVLDNGPVVTASGLKELSEYLARSAERTNDGEKSQRLKRVAERMKRRAIDL